MFKHHIPDIRSYEVLLFCSQVMYAARDVIIPAYACRQLRAWHDSAVTATVDTVICEVGNILRKPPAV